MADLCCFGGSKKRRLSRNKSKNREELVESALDKRLSLGDSEGEILSDFSTLSLKLQQRRLKKALKEEAKASREAEKMIKWVKQASQRIDASTVDGLLDEDEKSK